MNLQIIRMPSSEDVLIKFLKEGGARPISQVRLSGEDALRTFLTRRVHLESNEASRVIEEISLRRTYNSATAVVENVPLAEDDAYRLARPA